MTDAERLEQFLDEAGPDRQLFGGIDPGATGAVALVAGPYHFVADMPTVQVQKAGKTKAGGARMRTEIDPGGVCALFAPLEPFAYRTRFVIEKAWPRPGDTALTGFQVGAAYWVWPLFLHKLGVSLRTVSPGSWKKALGLDSRSLAKASGKAAATTEAAKAAMKEASRMEAQRRFPGAPLSAKAHHNRAEALLLAAWLRDQSVGTT